MLISWNITKECNLSCVHCYRDAGRKAEDELSFAEGKKLLSQIRSAGFSTVVLSGGEPLLRRDLYDLIEYGTKLSLRMVLGTNGTLIEKGVAKRLKSSGIARVGVSIDSIDQDVHNRFRRNRDAYQLTLKGIEALKYAQIPFQIHTTVMGLNYHQILEISEFAKNLGASSHHIFFLVHTGRAKEMREEVEVSEDAIDVLLRKILSTNQIETRPICAPQFVRIADEMGIPIKTRGCLAGISYAVVLPNGDLHPCPYLPIKAGNVRDEPLEKLFFESPLFYMLRTQKYKGGCGRCLYRDKCGGCRARAYQSTGDYMERDPLCSYSD